MVKQNHMQQVSYIMAEQNHMQQVSYIMAKQNHMQQVSYKVVSWWNKITCNKLAIKLDHDKITCNQSAIVVPKNKGIHENRLPAVLGITWK